MMNLSEMMNNLKVRIPVEDYILVDYELYFNEELGKYNRFSIDEKEGIQDIKQAISKVLSTDINAYIYICAYSYETIDYKGEKNIYADCIWLDTSIDIDSVRQLFESFTSVQPSSVSLLKEMDEYYQSHFYLFMKNGDIIDLKKNNSSYNFDNVIILYWD